MAENKSLRTGASLMVVGAIVFFVYAVIFFFRAFTGAGFELGVETLNGVTIEQLNALNPGVMYYINHLHVAVAGFIAATAIAVAALAWYGVRNGEMWALVAGVVSPVVGLAVALPMHWTGGFTLDWVAHLGGIYAGTLVFVIGALIALKGLVK